MILFKYPSRFIVPLTNFGFMRFFQRGADDSCLKSMLNALLELEDKIKYIEHYEFHKADPRCYYDPEVRELHCTTELGEEIIVQLENGYHRYSLDLSMYFYGALIQNEIGNHRPNFPLPRIQTITFLHFNQEQFKGDPAYKHIIKLVDQTSGKTFCDKITHIYIEMEKFNKKIDFASLPKVNEIGDPKLIADIWLYLLKNLSNFGSLPKALSDSVFQSFFSRGEIYHFTEKEEYEYFQSLMAYWGIEVMAKVEMEKRIDAVNYRVREMLKQGLKADKVAKIFGLLEEEVMNIQKDKKDL